MYCETESEKLFLHLTFTNNHKHEHFLDVQVSVPQTTTARCEHYGIIYHVHHLCLLFSCINIIVSGGSRISRRGGGVHLLRGSVDFRRGHFLVKMYAKTKELGPMGGGGAGHTPLDLPMIVQIKYIKGTT